MNKSMCIVLTVCGLSRTSLGITFDSLANSRLTITGWTSPGGQSQSGRPGGIGVNVNPGDQGLGGTGILEGTGTSLAGYFHVPIQPDGLQMGDAGTGVSIHTETTGQCSPTGFAFNSELTEGTLTFVNANAGAWTIGWVLDYNWSSTINGSDPATESGNTRSELTVFADGNQQLLRGQGLTYTPGGTVSDNNSAYGSIVIPGNSQLVLYSRSYTVGSIRATPAPGALGALGLGLTVVGLRRRRED